MIRTYREKTVPVLFSNQIYRVSDRMEKENSNKTRKRQMCSLFIASSNTKDRPHRQLIR